MQWLPQPPGLVLDALIGCIGLAIALAALGAGPRRRAAAAGGVLLAAYAAMALGWWALPLDPPGPRPLEEVLAGDGSAAEVLNLARLCLGAVLWFAALLCLLAAAVRGDEEPRPARPGAQDR
ncbi:hypothetical protein [Nocardiopsis coralliicola]